MAPCLSRTLNLEELLKKSFFLFGPRGTRKSDLVNERHLRGLLKLREEALIERYMVVSLGPEERTVAGITMMPWRRFLGKLWSDQLISPHR